MPRETVKFKYRCLEPACALLIRSDKWTKHCREKHGFKFKRNYEIKYKVVEVKQGDGQWKAHVPHPLDRDTHETGLPGPSYSSRSLEGIPTQNEVTEEAAAVKSDFFNCESSNACEIDMSSIQQQNSNSVLNNEQEMHADSEVHSIHSITLSDTDCNLESESQTMTKFDKPIPGVVISSGTHLEQNLASETKVIIHVNDPAKYTSSRITSDIISSLINCPCQPEMDYNFESTNNRRFLPAWFGSKLPDGTCKKRHWLSYSMSTNLAYCIDCMLFGGPTADVTWTRNGYSGWINGHGLRGIETHENQKKHKEAELARFQWIHNQRIDRKLSEQNTLLVDENRRVVVVAVKAIKYLAKEMMALRGHDSNSGKFLNLFKLLAEFNPCATAYLEKLACKRSRETCRKPEVNFLSPRNIRRLLNTMKDLVVKKISDAVGDQGAFSLIVDGTQDASKLEAVAVLVRYIENRDGNLRPTERLLDVFTTGDTSGDALCRRIVAILTAQRINLDWMIGQSYDGAGNMRGQFSGLKTRILEHAKKAIYVWCRAHRLNLVIESMLKCNTVVVGTIGLVQELYNFFTGHKRHAILVELQKDKKHVKTLKRVSDTTRSWRSTEDGVNTLLDCFDTVTTALDRLSTESNDTATVSCAIGLEKRLQDFPVIVCLFLLRTIFGITGPVSRLLQGVAADLSISATLLQGAMQSIQDIRNTPEQSWSRLLAEATSFAQTYNICPAFPEKRLKRIKKQPGELAQDEPIANGAQAFKIAVFIPVLDTLITQLQDRFSLEETKIMMGMQLFTPSSLFKNSSCVEDDIRELCINYSLDTTAVLKELVEFRPVYRQIHHLVNMDDLLPASSYLRSLNETKTSKTENEMKEESDSDVEAVQTQSLDEDDEGEQPEEQNTAASPAWAKWIDHSFTKPLRVVTELSGFDNLSCMYKNLASLAVTSCSAERAMSKVKIVKGNLRSTMLDDWYSSLLVLAAEKDLLDSLNENQIIDKFARCSLPLQKQLVYGFYV